MREYYGYLPPPPPGYVWPPGVDPTAVYDLAYRLKKREEKRLKRKEEEEKKKKDALKPKPPTFSALQVLLILLAFGLPVGSVNFFIANFLIQAIRRQLGLP